MAEAFRASFVLALKDDISAGLQKIIRETKQLRDLARSLGFKPLEGASAIVGRVDRDVVQLNRDLGATARQAETAAGALRRLGAAELGRVREQAASFRLGQQIAGGAGLGQLYPMGFRPPAPLGAPFEGAPSSRVGWRGRAGNAWANARAGIANASEHIGLMGGAIAGISLMEPIKEAAEFDNVLTHIAITAGATADTIRGKVAEMAKTYRDMALQTNQTSHDIGESAQFLITTGIGEAMTNRLLPMIAKAATAYNTPMQDAVQGAFSMHEELRIAPEDMQGALSAAALAAKQGHFSFSDISSFLPAVAAQAATAGIQGREGLNSLLAALETSRRGAGTSGQAATNLTDFLGYINSPIGARSFGKVGIDLPGLLRSAEKAGINPLEAVVERVRRLTAGMSDAQSAATLGQLFHNQEARIFVETMLRELQYYEDTKKKISGASDQTIDEDFKRSQNLFTRLKTLTEQSKQLTQRLGDGFSWVVPVGIALTGGLLVGLQWMDTHLPGVATAVISTVGGMLGLVAVMGVLGTVAGPIKAGAALLRLGGVMRLVLGGASALLNPYTLAFAALAGVIYEIVEHWRQFGRDVREIGAGIQQMFSGDLQGGIARAWAGLKDILEQPFKDFQAWLNSWGEGLGTQAADILQKSFGGWVKFFEDIKQRIAGVGQHPADNRRDQNEPAMRTGPNGIAPIPPAQNPMLFPGAYHPAAGGGGARVVHIHFTSDVPGRAAVREGSDAGQARGPMLLRA